MTRLIELLIALAIVLALFLVVGLLLPSSRHLEDTVETNRKMTIVYDTLSSTRRFDDWNPLVLRDPQMQRSMAGPESGEGASFEYSSDADVGDGSWTIVEAVPGERVVYALENNHRGHDKRMTFEMEPTGRNNRNVKVTQRYDVEYGWDILGRYEGLYVARDVGDAMKMGLNRLGNLLATVPNYDYAVLKSQPEVVDRPAENVLFVPATVERRDSVVENQMRANLAWIQKVMEANNLEAAGPVQVVTIEFGTENYAFELAQPVRRRGTGSGAGRSDDAGDADAGDAAAPAADDTDAGRIEIALQGPVEYRFVERHRAATASTSGHMAALSIFRDGVRAWALTRGYETTGRPYESWNSGISASFTEGEFDVYWPLK